MLISILSAMDRSEGLIDHEDPTDYEAVNFTMSNPIFLF